MKKECYSIREFARLTNMSPAMVYWLIKQKRLKTKAFKQIVTRIPHSELLREKEGKVIHRQAKVAS